MIRALEEISLNMLPALNTLYYDGWVLRFANGFTRRANSVTPIYPSTLPLDEKLAYCETLFAAAGLPSRFKLTRAAQPENLEAALDAHGYGPGDISNVMIIDDLASSEAPKPADVTIFETLDESWFAAYAALNNVAPEDINTMRRMLMQLVLPCGFMLLRHEGQPAAVGLGVVDRGWMGAFDIVTAAQLRGRGIGTQLMLNLLAWGRQNNAQRAYLQVQSQNLPAMRLYTRIGFQPLYQYWYREKP